jgi:hypothetical protein
MLGTLLTGKFLDRDYAAFKKRYNGAVCLGEQRSLCSHRRLPRRIVNGQEEERDQHLGVEQDSHRGEKVDPDGSYQAALFAKTYGISQLNIGLTFLANGFGCMLGTLLTGKFLDRERGEQQTIRAVRGSTPIEDEHARWGTHRRVHCNVS